MMTRRDLLKSAGGLMVAFSLPRSFAQGLDDKPLDPKEVDSFLMVKPDGSVAIYCGKVDVGTGLRIAVRQMCAEELGVSFDKVDMTEGDTALTPDQGSTGGSTGLTRGGAEIRQASATAREALLKMGAAQLKRSNTELELVNGEVRPIGGGAGIGIGALVGGKRFSMKVDEKAVLKPASSYKVVGQAIPRPDIPGKVTARNGYLHDLTLPGMLHARVVRPKGLGSKVVQVDEASIAAIPDVKVLRQNSFIAVVSKDEWAAVRAARELKVVWSDWQGLPGSDQMEPWLRKAAIDRDQVIVTKGNSAPALASAAKKFSATFYWPNQSHASMGPSCAVADYREDLVRVWTASQGPHAVRQNVAKVFGLPDSKVRVTYLDGAGSYGTNGGDDAAAEAVLISKLVKAPVRLQWMRQEEHGWDPKGPQQLLDLRAGLDAQGNIVAWENEMWLPTSIPGTRPLVGIEAAGIAQDHGMGSGLLSQNGDPPYDCPNIKVTAHWTKETPLRPSNLRAPGKIANAFAVEAFVDELAAAAGEDPVAFRLKRLKDPRAIEVIRKAADTFGWDKRPAKGSGRGFAYARYKQIENYVAIAMEASVDRATGKVIVRRVVCAHDCGIIVNPDALRNQVEGCIVQTISRALYEEAKFNTSAVTSVDWVSYPILRFSEVPDVEVLLINRPDQPLWGAGEAATAPVAGAIANAIFDAAGVRMRTAPFTAERVKAALSGGGRS